MAAASGVAASGFAGMKVELLVRRSSPVRGVGFGIGPMKARIGVRVRRGPRCEASDASRASSVSALEQFKISGTDRESFFFFFVFCLFPYHFAIFE